MDPLIAASPTSPACPANQTAFCHFKHGKSSIQKTNKIILLLRVDSVGKLLHSDLLGVESNVFYLKNYWSLVPLLAQISPDR